MKKRGLDTDAKNKVKVRKRGLQNINIGIKCLWMKNPTYNVDVNFLISEENPAVSCPSAALNTGVDGRPVLVVCVQHEVRSRWTSSCTYKNTCFTVSSR